MKIFDIQRFCVNDGKGIRTTVFFRECPLRCKWCANPESWADFKHSKYFTIKEMTAQEVLQEILKDKDYYDNSGGGVTLSGGEPLLHLNERLPLIKLLKKNQIDITVETCGNIPQKNLQIVESYVNQFFFDVKHVNAEKLKTFTGGDAKLILSNLKFLREKKANVQVRIPVIPGFNYSNEDMTQIFKTLHNMNVESVVLIPYHTLGKEKYKKLGIEYPYREYDTMLTEKEMRIFDYEHYF